MKKITGCFVADAKVFSMLCGCLVKNDYFSVSLWDFSSILLSNGTIKANHSLKSHLPSLSCMVFIMFGAQVWLKDLFKLGQSTQQPC